MNTRKLLSFLGIALLAVCWSVVPAFAGADTDDFENDRHKASWQDLRWQQNVDVSSSSVVDTMVAGEIDSSTSISIAGASTVSVTLILDGYNDSNNIVITPQVAGNADQGVGNIAWQSLSSTFSVATTEGGAVGQTAGSYADTVTMILLTPEGAVGDSVVSEGEGTPGFHLMGRGNMTVVGQASDLRLYLDAGASAGDTVLVRAFVNRIYD